MVELQKRLEMRGYRKEPYFNSDTSFVFEKVLKKDAEGSLRMRFQTWDHSEFRTENQCCAEACAMLVVKGDYKIETDISSRENFDIEQLEKFAYEILNKLAVYGKEETK